MYSGNNFISNPKQSSLWSNKEHQFMDMANSNFRRENEEDSDITDTDKIIKLRKTLNESPDYENDNNMYRNPTPQFKQTRFNIPPVYFVFYI